MCLRCDGAVACCRRAHAGGCPAACDSRRGGGGDAPAARRGPLHTQRSVWHQGVLPLPAAGRKGDRDGAAAVVSDCFLCLACAWFACGPPVSPFPSPFPGVCVCMCMQCGDEHKRGRCHNARRQRRRVSKPHVPACTCACVRLLLGAGAPMWPSVRMPHPLFCASVYVC